jgi:hypothetical protein
MGFFKKLGGFFSPRASIDEASYYIKVKCNRCGEEIQARINLYNELSIEYDDSGNISMYICHKVIVGSQRCYQPIDIVLKFDPKRRLVEKEITGGKFVENSAQ